jgi:heterotetrameric sarcosine oxidase gamma subunit
MMNTTTPIARGPLSAAHRASRARIVALNGWEVAAEFDGCAAELARARTTVGIADLSHLAKLQISGTRLESLGAQFKPTESELGEPLRSGRAWMVESTHRSSLATHHSLLCAWLADDQLVAISLDAASTHFASSQPYTLLPTPHSLLDVTGHFAVFDVVGPCGEALLCQLTSIDVSARSFPPGHCAQTGVARIPAILIRPTSTALARMQVWCAREYGQYLGETLREKAAPMGGGPMGWEAWRGTFE